MKQEIKTFFKKYWVNINSKNEKIINKIIWSIKSRYECYWEIGISRKEFKKFWATEDKVRKILEKLQKIWFLLKFTIFSFKNSILFFKNHKINKKLSDKL